MTKYSTKGAQSGRLSSSKPNLSNLPSTVAPASVPSDDLNLKSTVTEKPTYVLKFDDCTKKKLPAALVKEPLFIFEFKDKASYVVSRTNKLAKEKAYMHFSSDDRSYSIREADLKNMSQKTKKDILGIEFEDSKTKTKCYVVIQDLIQWNNDKDYEMAQKLMKEFSK